MTAVFMPLLLLVAAVFALQRQAAALSVDLKKALRAPTAVGSRGRLCEEGSDAPCPEGRLPVPTGAVPVGYWAPGTVPVVPGAVVPPAEAVAPAEPARVIPRAVPMEQPVIVPGPSPSPCGIRCVDPENKRVEWNSTGPIVNNMNVTIPNSTAQIYKSSAEDAAWLQRLRQGGLVKMRESHGQNESWRPETWIPTATEEGKMPSSLIVQDAWWKETGFLTQVNDQSAYTAEVRHGSASTCAASTRPSLRTSTVSACATEDGWPPARPLYTSSQSSYNKAGPTPAPLVPLEPLWPLFPDRMASPAPAPAT